MKTKLILKIDNRKGYTLIEIIIAMAIFSFLAGIAISAYIGMKPSLRKSGAVRQIMGDLMWARMQAISQNNEFKVFFKDDHQYQILDDDNNNGTIDAGEFTITKNIRDKYKDITISSNNDPIFYPRGNASNLATVTITNSSGIKKITVAISGRTQIQ